MQANHQGFLEVLQRYIDGACSPAEKQMMDYWYDLLDHRHSSSASALSDEQQEALLWAKIQQRIRQKKPYDNGPPG
ncbi:hypothetical protein [Larkinella arboricola]